MPDLQVEQFHCSCKGVFVVPVGIADELQRENARLVATHQALEARYGAAQKAARWILQVFDPDLGTDERAALDDLEAAFNNQPTGTDEGDDG